MKIPFRKDNSSRRFQLPGWEAIAAGAGVIGVAVGSWFAYSRFSNGTKPFGSDGKPSEDLTKDELYARAQEEDITGRSNMKKDELIDALRKEQ